MNEVWKSGHEENTHLWGHAGNVLAAKTAATSPEAVGDGANEVFVKQRATIAGSGAGKRAGIQLPAEASDEVKEEAKWWNMRLDITREFGKEIIKETGEASGGAPLLDGEGCKA